MPHHDNAIRTLMAVPPAGHDLEWLRDALRAAIRLEFATIPPYLIAMWSVKDPADPVVASIRDIVREEMLHMGIACNLLVAVGGDPALNAPGAVPAYPGPLPGGVHPGLTVALASLSPATLDTFLQIELPEHGPIALATAAAGEEFPTIGAFYSAIGAAFDGLAPPLAQDRQIARANFGLQKLASLNDVRAAIALIKHQGEGSSDSPADPTDAGLAHYYQFREIQEGRRIKVDPATGRWGFSGEPLPFPECHPVRPVPWGGYARADVPDANVWQMMTDFDAAFTTVVNELQAAWATGDASHLSQSVGVMRGDMSDLGVAIVAAPRADGGGNYAPSFRVLQTA